MRMPIAELKDRLQLALDLNNKKAIDLANDLDIPKSAISQYLSGKSKKLDSVRIFIIAEYLNVSEAWLMGFDVPMERPKVKEVTFEEIKNNDILADIIVRMRTDEDFLSLVKVLNNLDKDKIAGVMQMLQAFAK